MAVLDTHLLTRVCNVCQGDGVFNGIECWNCKGEGFRHDQGYCLPSGHVWTNQIFDCIDLTEYAALTDSNKTLVRTMLSLTLVNLSEGSNVLTKLRSIFASSPTTLAAINVLAGGA